VQGFQHMTLPAMETDKTYGRFFYTKGKSSDPLRKLGRRACYATWAAAVLWLGSTVDSGTLRLRLAHSFST
jgi:hypothetical protein